MTEKQEIRAKSMELALSFIGLAFELPTDAEGYGEQELAMAFNTAVKWSKKFENFICEDSDPKRQ